MKPLLLQHLSGEPIGRFPVWAMRQAGRYLPQYRAIRTDHTFWQMVTNPELAAQVSLTPVGTLPIDGIIFFSDILTLPYGLGVPIEMREGVGPVCTAPLRTAAAFEVFRDFSAQKHTPYVGEALKIVRQRAAPEIALLGFAGAPWTVASYLAEGKSGRKFEAIRTWMHRDPVELTAALSSLADATVDYLKAQVEGGAQIVQLFDTWLSEMPRAYFTKHYLPLLNGIFRKLRADKIPVIFYSRHAHHLLDDLAGLEVDVLSTDELLPLTEVEKRTHGKFSLQGNLDPLLLFGDEGVVRRETRLLVGQARELKKPAILNLGHGILPGTPVENVRAFFEEARTLWV
jgi:uroporphyrinogen decarboxylase